MTEPNSRRRSFVALLAPLVLLTSACTSDDSRTIEDASVDEVSTGEVSAGKGSPDEQPPASPDTVSTDEVDEFEEPDDTAPSGDGSNVERASVDLTLTRDDIGCDAEALGEDELIVFDVAHYVVNGVLGEVCRGDQNDTVIEAWELLAAMTPPGQLGDLGLFTGFVSGDEGGEVTLAFVNAIDSDGTQFQMSVNIDTAQDDPDELLLTLAHEFTHVFTALETQIDRSDESIDTCSTYDNGEGCYDDDSLMYAWIVEFWDDGLIDELDPEESATAAVGQDRCDRDARFFGPYAASNPEEDFAETFSAYVLRVPADSAAQQDKLDWIDDQPGLREFQDRAADARLGPLDNSFEPCGLG